MTENRRAPRVEPQDVYNHFARVACDQQLGVALAFSGQLDEQRLRDAVARVVASQPVLGCRFVYADGRARFEPVPAGALVSVVDADDAWAAASAAASEPLDFAGAGVLAVTFVRGPDSDALAVRIDHTAADGQGAKQSVALLAGAYGAASAGAPGPTAAAARTRADAAPDAAPAPALDRSARRLMRRFSLAQRIRALRGREAPRPTWGLPPLAGGTAGQRHHVVATIPPARFSAVRAKAKGVGATVNDVALAAFYRSLFRELGPAEGKPMAVNVSFDMRRYLDAADPMPSASNLSSVETALVARIADEPFGAAMERIVAETSRLKAGTPGLGSAVLLDWASRLGHRRFERMVVEPMQRGRHFGVSFPFLSNFGVLDEAAFSFGAIAPTAAVVLPPASHPPFVMVGVSSFAGTLAFATGYCDGEMDPAVSRRIVDGMASDITMWSAASS